MHHCDSTEDLWTAWNKWIYMVNESEQNPDGFDWLDGAPPLYLADIIVASQPASSSDISKPEPIAEPVVNVPRSTSPQSQITPDSSSHASTSSVHASTSSAHASTSSAHASTSSAPVSSTPLVSSRPHRNRRPRQEDRRAPPRENDVWSHDRFGEDGEPQVPHGRLGGPAKGRGRSGGRGRKPRK
ncbi:uncharacterized protein STEHIDRAFT_123916 [Stereum hirsutum FP-91666 SS1]|uniref:uncharacterized protein n=1 Tax=Stereum hirsutum (strain FP-91666) TaxID=721885 RepID=UPI000444A382|nr:uncharacterized protein STEHIDRAFT_123916 [Stereum hirsutum FP-91666 SS1]EIM83504.1 hypothetical protein STEHIDRAFT_123916 [Stereum hirsutum FP-91666 SS1]